MFNHFKLDISECSKTIRFRYHEEFFSAAMKEFVSRCARSLSLLQHFLEMETIDSDVSISSEQLEALLLSGDSWISQLWKEVEVLKDVSPPDQTITLMKRVRCSIKKRRAAAHKNSLLKLLLKTVDTLMREQYPQDGMSSANMLLSNVNQHIHNLDTVISDARKLIDDVPRDCMGK